MNYQHPIHFINYCKKKEGGVWLRILTFNLLTIVTPPYHALHLHIVGSLAEHPTQNANPQTLAITGVSADCIITKVVER